MILLAPIECKVQNEVAARLHPSLLANVRRIMSASKCNSFRETQTLTLCGLASLLSDLKRCFMSIFQCQGKLRRTFPLY